mmetsp:Transcript_60786/g.144823  ORF Transcript_60786/g.144823 Transcript_60786/m.144823 type:complete len:785 (-) Transcript_60786:128-2482(-)
MSKVEMVEGCTGDLRPSEMSADTAASLSSPCGHNSACGSTRTCFKEQIVRELARVAGALEQEHLAILHQQEQAFQIRLAKLSSELALSSSGREADNHNQLQAAAAAGATPRSQVDDLDKDSDDCAQDSPRIVPPEATSPDLLPTDGTSLGQGISGSSRSVTAALRNQSTKGTASGIGLAAPTRTMSSSGLTFKLLEEWITVPEDGLDLDESHIAAYQYKASLTRMLERDSYGSQGIAAKNSAVLVLSPFSARRMVWDALAALVLMYDGFMTPLMAAFDVPRSFELFVMGVIVMFYWTLDIFVGFMSAYQLPDGEVEARCSRIARKYASTWLFFDIMLVTVDWFTLGPRLAAGWQSEADSVQSVGLVRLGKVARFGRALRLLRLVRLAKVINVMRHVNDFIGMESTAIIVSIIKNIGMIMVVNHFLACAWFVLGDQNPDHGWLSTVEHKNSTWWHNYLLSMHWSISNFTPGSSAPSPRTTEELLFAVVVLFFALVIFSVFVSSTTSLISRLVNMKSAKNRQIWILKGFLRQNHFPSDLRDRVMRYVKTALGSKKDVTHRSDVELLTLLSQPLREEVQMSLHLRTVSWHPLLKLLAFSQPALMRKLSTEALEETSFSRGDFLFGLGESYEKMGFLECGVLKYSCIRRDHDSAHSHKEDTLVTPKQTFCEAVLWTKWRCRGNMQADTDCDLLMLDAPRFRMCVRRHQMVIGLVQSYAQSYLEVLELAAAGGLANGAHLSDLQHRYPGEEPMMRFFAEPWIQDLSHNSISTGGSSSVHWFQSSSKRSK